MSTAAPFASQSQPSAVDAYLQQLAPGSRRVMASSLQLIADALSQGKASAADFPWGKATYADAVRLREWLTRGYAPATAARHLCAWRCVLREAWRLGQMPTDAYLRARDVRAPRRGEQRRGRLLRVDEVAALLNVQDPSVWDVRDSAMVAIVCGCGLRRAELCGLDREHVDLATGAISVRRAKGGRPRDLVLPARMRALLRSDRWRLSHPTPSPPKNSRRSVVYAATSVSTPAPRGQELVGLVSEVLVAQSQTSCAQSLLQRHHRNLCCRSIRGAKPVLSPKTMPSIPHGPLPVRRLDA